MTMGIHVNLAREGCKREYSQRLCPAMWGPRSIAKLVNITPITMVYGIYNELVTGANLNQLISWGPHIVESLRQNIWPRSWQGSKMVPATLAKESTACRMGSVVLCSPMYLQDNVTSSRWSDPSHIIFQLPVKQVTNQPRTHEVKSQWLLIWDATGSLGIVNQTKNPSTIFHTIQTM